MNQTQITVAAVLAALVVWMATFIGLVTVVTLVVCLVVKILN